MATQIPSVVFDLGGVLIDWNPRYLYRKLFGGDEAAMERFLAEVCTPEWNVRLDAGRPFAEGVAELVAAHPEQAELIAAYQERWPEMLGEAFEGTVAILRELRRAGLRTYALSNWSAETFAVTRTRYPFLAQMDGILISGQVKVGKPDPAIFREFLRRFGLAPENTIYIDDSDRNVVAAAALGMTAVRFVNAAKLRRDLRALGLPLATLQSGNPVERGKIGMELAPELANFIAGLSPGPPGDLDALGAAGRALGIEWPPDYVAVMASRDGGEGEIDGWPIRLWPAGKLADVNAGPRSRIGSGIVWFGWDGRGEDYGFDRATGKVVLLATGAEVEVLRDSLVDWIRRPPNFSDSRSEAVRNLARAADRRDRRERSPE